jgi:hypothetical protein
MAIKQYHPLCSTLSIAVLPKTHFKEMLKYPKMSVSGVELWTLENRLIGKIWNRIGTFCSGQPLSFLK